MSLHRSKMKSKASCELSESKEDVKRSQPTDLPAEFTDGDTCNNIDAYFKRRPPLLREKALSLDENYILNISGTKTKIVAHTSNGNCELLSISNLQNCGTLAIDSADNIRDVRFAPNDENMLYVACQSGCIKLFDIRSSELVREYKEELSKKTNKPLSSFDVSSNGKVLGVGSELFQSYAFIIFYDQRVTKPLGGYWDSHTDEVTQVKFHPTQSHKLITGSSDGLINVFDISEQNESDALQYSLNTESLVEKLSWLGNSMVSCVLQEHGLQIWNVETADKLSEFSRDFITKKLKRKSKEDCYLVDTHMDSEDRVSILCGSQFEEGDVLRSLNVVNSKLEPSGNFVGNKQIVRCAWNNKSDNLLVTGGESGIVNIWRLDSQTGNTDSTSTKLITKVERMKIHKKGPYNRRK